MKKNKILLIVLVVGIIVLGITPLSTLLEGVETKKA